MSLSSISEPSQLDILILLSKIAYFLSPDPRRSCMFVSLIPVYTCLGLVLPPDYRTLIELFV